MADGVTTSLSKNVSRAELALLAKHLKDEKFRALLTEFADEVSAPGKREQFEKEVIALEAERGVQVVFVEPKPGFAIALQVQNNKPDDQSHVYVNICSSEDVDKPKCTRVDTGDKKGLNWALPHLIPQPRKEVLASEVVPLLPGQQAASGNKDAAAALLVYDVVFHPDALHLAARNRLMRDTVIKSAVDSLVSTYKLTVKCNIEIEKVEYVGKITRSTVKKVVNEKLNKQSQSEENYVSFPPPREENQVESDERTSKNENCEPSKKPEKAIIKDGTLEPVHKIKYVSRSDLQDYAIPIIPQCGAAFRPSSLEITVELPSIERASQVDVDITHQHLVLTTDSIPKYKLDLNLPYPVDEELSTAKFDVATKKLTLTLSVIEASSKTENINVCSPASDSGIECESGYRTNSDGDNSSEVSVSSQEDLGVVGCDEVQSCGGEDKDISVWEEPEPEIKSKALLIPSYNISQSKDVLEISIYAGNVMADSVKIICKHLNQVEVSYSSIGGGYVPLTYQVVILCPHDVVEESIKYDICEHTFDIHIPKKESVPWKTLQVGNHENLNAVEIGNYSELMLSSEKSDDTSESAIHTSTESVIQETLEASTTQAVIKTESEVEVLKTPERPPPEVVETSRKSRLCRAVSECESQAAANRKRQGLTGSWPRGILKRRTRSLSDSQSGRFSPNFDALSSLGSSQELEENGDVMLEVADDDDALSSSVKKSVRFNEVVSRQLFRSNSSILGGQGAKNQKKIKKEKVPLLDESDRDSCSDSSPHKKKEVLKYLEKLDSDITTTDSNTDPEDNNEATENIDPNVKSKKQVQGSNNNINNINNNNNNVDKNGKKNKRNKNKNKKLELSNNMIFQLDIEA